MGTFLFSVVYISLILPSFWRDLTRASIVAFSILSNLGLFQVYFRVRWYGFIRENALLLVCFKSYQLAFASMIVMITVGPRMATLTALMTSVFHATMQNAGIDAFATGFSSALWDLFFAVKFVLQEGP